MGMKLLTRRCLTCVATVRHLHTPKCPHFTLRNAGGLSDQSELKYQPPRKPLHSNLYSCRFSADSRKSFSNQISRPLQISPDFFTENCEEIISRIKQIDSSETLQLRRFRKAAEDDSPKFAIFIPFCIADGEPSVLFNVRSAKLTSHRGQVSFPGGRIDGTDVDATHTALREMDEELGIPESCVNVWGELLPSLNTQLQFIHVFAGFIGHFESMDIHINPNEVESVFTLTLRHLCDLRNRGYTIFEGRGINYTSCVFLGAEHRVWGISANALDNALSIILPEDYIPTMDHFGVVREW